MKKLSLFVTLNILLILAFHSCEKDDICAEGEPTTPQLVLRFHDLADPDETKAVPGLFAYGLNDNDEIVEFLGVIISNNDSIAIPLRTDANETRFVLHQNFAIDDNGTPEPEDDILLGNPDIINVNYIREDVYVSRACGFKTIFNNIIFSVGIDGDNWIINSEVANQNVENQNQAHVKIFH